MNRLRKILRFKPTQIIIMSFVLMITIGTLLLMLPLSTTNGQGLKWIDALFVSTSASCVTGLTVVDLHNDLTFFGKVVIKFGDLPVYAEGLVTKFDEEAMRKILAQHDITVDISLNLGEASATVYSCDLSFQYVKINADYTT